MYYVKPFLILLLTITATYPSAAGEKLDVFDKQLESALATRSSDITPQLNKYVDKILKKLAEILNAKGHNNVDIDDYNNEFLAVGFIKIRLNLTSGKLNNMAAFKRSGNVSVTRDDDFTNLNVPVQFNLFNYHYNYVATHVSHGTIHHGNTNGRIYFLTANLLIKVNRKNFDIVIDKFTVTEQGFVSVRFVDNPSMDWLLNPLSKEISPDLKKIFAKTVEEFDIQKIIEEPN